MNKYYYKIGKTVYKVKPKEMPNASSVCESLFSDNNKSECAVSVVGFPHLFLSEENIGSFMKEITKNFSDKFIGESFSFRFFLGGETGGVFCSDYKESIEQKIVSEREKVKRFDENSTMCRIGNHTIEFFKNDDIMRERLDDVKSSIADMIVYEGTIQDLNEEEFQDVDKLFWLKNPIASGGDEVSAKQYFNFVDEKLPFDTLQKSLKSLTSVLTTDTKDVNSFVNVLIVNGLKGKKKK